MGAEYLLLNLVIAVPPLVLAGLPSAEFGDRWRPAALAIAAMAVPFLIWDALVTGSHWHFDPRYVLGPRIAGLPFEEVLFFATVPFACLFLWHSVFRTWPRAPRPGLRWIHPLFLLAAPVGVAAFALGRQYTGLALLALAAVAWADRRLGVRLLQQPRFLLFGLWVLALTLFFNGYLTARPVVLYGESYQLGWRVFTIPAEDFVYGFALVMGVVVGFEALVGRRAAPAAGRRRGWAARLVERRFGGYRHRIDDAASGRPIGPPARRRVAVVGGGLAGLSAAATLAERGFEIELLERQSHLGGKVGAWSTRLPDGASMGVGHGFHAFFRHYYNLRRMLERIGADRHLVPIDDYRILGRDGAEYSFEGVHPAPLLNLFSMARHGVYRIRDVALGPAGQELAAFMEYDAERTFERFDGESFADFAERAKLPASLKLVFQTFARAFFADADRISMAELIKSFHSYYLSHDHGLIYDYLDDDYEASLLAPFRRYLEAHGVRIRTGRAVERLERDGEAFRVDGQNLGLDGQNLGIDGQTFDHVVLAADARSTRAILEASEFVAAEDPELHARLPHLRSGQRYAVLRLWLDRDLERDLPVFVITEKIRVLDSISVYHRIERESAEWVEKNGGGIFELHCYAVPDDVGSDDAIRDGLLGELHHWLPELRDARIVHEVFQVRDDFAAFHVGMAEHRPGFRTAVPGLLLAGDWVRLPCPAMLMEAACTAGLLCANAILDREGLRPEPVESVPLRGLFARAPRLGRIR